MVLSPDGIIAQHKWLEIPEHHEYAIPEDFVIMPNHVHGIIQIKGQVQAGLNPTGPQYSKLTTTIGSFKSGVSREIGRTNCSHEFKWQKSFYDHIIRDEFSYYNIVKYIAENPLKWALDIENSAVEGHLEQYYENIYRGIE
jgi:REP element-mobilizing transposase RayT